MRAVFKPPLKGLGGKGVAQYFFPCVVFSHSSKFLKLSAFHFTFAHSFMLSHSLVLFLFPSPGFSRKHTTSSAYTAILVSKF